MIDSALSFSKDYQDARAKFLLSAREAGCVLDSVRHPERGPEGGELYSDIAWLGPRNAEHVLVMLSATHGVEGFCGSGAQVDWLRRGEYGRLNPNTAVLLVHAINPYGFAWLRRVTHENVDLNRNWIDFGQPLPENPQYMDLREAIVPLVWSEESHAATAKAFFGYADKHGRFALVQALTGGQYGHAEGIWYGGTSPTWSRRTQTAIYGEYLGQARCVAILDYHTGLGPWGLVEEICSFPADTSDYRRAKAFFGAAVVSVASGESTSSVILGDGLRSAPSILANAEVTGVAMEFGTLPGDLVLESVRADAWLHARGEVDSPLGHQIKQQIRDAFYGDRDDWKGLVAGQSLLVTRQALAGLAAS